MSNADIRTLLVQAFEHLKMQAEQIHLLMLEGQALRETVIWDGGGAGSVFSDEFHRRLDYLRSNPPADGGLTEEYDSIIRQVKGLQG